MGRRALEDQSTRSITKLGTKSFAVTIPIDYVRELGWKEKQLVDVKITKSGKVIITRLVN